MGQIYVHVKRVGFNKPAGVAFNATEFEEFRTTLCGSKKSTKSQMTSGKVSAKLLPNGEVQLNRTSEKGLRTLILSVQEHAALLTK